MKSIYVPELIEKLDMLVNEGMLSLCEDKPVTSCYIFNFPFKTDTNDIFDSLADLDITNAKKSKVWNKANEALYIDFVKVFRYHKNEWQRERDEMQNYGWILKQLQSVDAIISHIKRVYKNAVKVWSDSQEKILLSAIDAL